MISIIMCVRVIDECFFEVIVNLRPFAIAVV